MKLCLAILTLLAVNQFFQKLFNCAKEEKYKVHARSGWIFSSVQTGSEPWHFGIMVILLMSALPGKDFWFEQGTNCVRFEPVFQLLDMTRCQDMIAFEAVKWLFDFHWVGLCVSVAVAQYDGPLPPRPIIPGAAPVGYSPGSGGRPSLRRRPVSRGFSDEQPPPRRPNSRGAAPRRLPPPIGLEQSLQARPPPPRPLYQDSPIAVVRPPILSSPPQVRPVVEDDDDEDSDSYEDRQPQTQQPFHPTPQQQLPQPTPPQQLFNSIDDFPVPTRQQFRPQQQQIQQEEEQPQQQQFVRQSRPQQAAPARQQTQAEIPRQEPARPKPYANQQYNRQQQVARPVQKEIAHSKATDQPTNRQKKPTSQ
ncbi:unnamed protein product, partial [Nesidiocoris tenuis]